MTQKQTSVILDANGGLHSKRALKKVKTNLQSHGLKRAILVHMVLTGSQSVQVYRDTYNDIADHIRDNGSRCEYFGCLEMDEVKGLHAHIFFIIETSKKFPHATLDVNDGAWLHRLAERRGLNRIHVAQPQNKMHYAKGKPQFFARLNDEAKLADCLERIEYLYKNRSKDGVPCREVYFNSEFKANAARRAAKKAIALDSPPIDAPASKEEAISTEDKGNDMTTLTPAAFKYVAGIYETAVDAGMNVAEIQAHLKDNGIVRSLWQVRNDLSNVFGFASYVDAHPAPPRPDVAELDKMIDRTPERLVRPPTGLTRHERTYAA